MLVTLGILAGGQARRMGGRPKGLIPWNGAPLIASVARRLEPLCATTLVATNDPPAYAFLGRRAVRDRIAGAGAAGGLHALLAEAAHERVLAVACDMPLASPALARALIAISLADDAADVVVPHHGGRAQPLFAVYRRRCLREVAAALADGTRALHRIVERLAARHVAEPDVRRLEPAPDAFVNVNTEDELARARRLDGQRS